MRGDGRMQGGRDRDRVAIQPEAEGGDNRHLDVAEPERGGDGDRRQQMGRVEQADIELVAHVRPGDFAHQIDVEPFGGGEALVDGDDERARIDQWDEADGQPGAAHLSISAAVMIDCAISTIFFFSRIAVLRISE